MYPNLNPEKALIFRIVHRENVGTMLRNGLHSRNSPGAAGRYVQIGNGELIEKRRSRVVGPPHGGTLSDYVPFYFTPFSPMLYNIKTGHNGIEKRLNEDIVILVSSIHRLHSKNIPFVFTDRHAYLKFTRYSSNIADLNWIDWDVLQKRDFRKDDVDKFDRYQAEALVYGHMPINGLIGAICYNDAVKSEVETEAGNAGFGLNVVTRTKWYF